MMNLPPDSPAPAHWLVYFTVDHLETAAERIGALGGAGMMGPMPSETGRLLVARDPQGAPFALFEGEVDP